MAILVNRRIAFNRYPPIFLFSVVMLRDAFLMYRDVQRCSPSQCYVQGCIIRAPICFGFWKFSGGYIQINREKEINTPENIVPTYQQHSSALGLAHTGGEWYHTSVSFTYSIKSAGWQFSNAHILSMFWSAMYFPSRKDCITPSANSFSLRSLLVLQPASFNASRMFILYLIKASPPFLLGALFQHPHYSTRLHRNQCKKQTKYYTDFCVICEQTLHRKQCIM